MPTQRGFAPSATVSSIRYIATGDAGNCNPELTAYRVRVHRGRLGARVGGVDERGPRSGPEVPAAVGLRIGDLGLARASSPRGRTPASASRRSRLHRVRADDLQVVAGRIEPGEPMRGDHQVASCRAAAPPEVLGPSITTLPPALLRTESRRSAAPAVRDHQVPGQRLDTVRLHHERIADPDRHDRRLLRGAAPERPNPPSAAIVSQAIHRRDRAPPGISGFLAVVAAESAAESSITRPRPKYRLGG